MISYEELLDFSKNKIWVVGADNEIYSGCLSEISVNIPSMQLGHISAYPEYEITLKKQSAIIKLFITGLDQPKFFKTRGEAIDFQWSRLEHKF